MGVSNDTRNGELTVQGKVIDHVTDDQARNYGMAEADFAEPWPGGRVLVLLSYP